MCPAILDWKGTDPTNTIHCQRCLLSQYKPWPIYLHILRITATATISLCLFLFAIFYDFLCIFSGVLAIVSIFKSRKCFVVGPFLWQSAGRMVNWVRFTYRPNFLCKITHKPHYVWWSFVFSGILLSRFLLKTNEKELKVESPTHL